MSKICMSAKADRDAKILLLASRFPHAKPRSREQIVIFDANGNKSIVNIGAFLGTLPPYFTRKGGKETLGVDSVAMLRSLPWFEAWIEGVRAKRSRGRDAALPALDEQVELLCENYPEKRPTRGSRMEVKRKNGALFTLCAYSLLDRIADNFHQTACDAVSSNNVKTCRLNEETCRLVRSMPWASRWIEECAKLRLVAQTRKFVTKEMKLQLMLTYYPEHKPMWRDAPIPVAVPELESTFQWRAATWLDDIADNWLRQKQPSVRLDESQMQALQTLPWMKTWLSGLSRTRARSIRSTGGNNCYATPATPATPTL